MATNGIFVITSPFSQLVARFKACLPELLKHSNGMLYVHLLPGVNAWPPQRQSIHLSLYSNVVRCIYSHTMSVSPGLDVRVLLNGIKPNLNPLHLKLRHPVRSVFFEKSSDGRVIHGYMNGLPDSQSIQRVVLSEDVEERVREFMTSQDNVPESENVSDTYEKIYKNVVLGGTFDRLHPGHKILLCEAILRAKNSLTIGVTSDEMVKRKILWELIEPVEKRIDRVLDFVEDQDRFLQYKVVCINDPFGPAIVDPELELITASRETESGCHKINQLRKEADLKELELFIISLLDDPIHGAHEEGKVSSSSARMRLLGEEVKPSSKGISEPYVIGLTGGSASGKTSIAEFLGKNYEDVVGVVDCDKLGHLAYAKGTKCFESVVDEFGSDIVNTETGEIDRKVLGSKVFGNSQNKKKLEGIVWPRILEKSADAVREFGKKGKKIVILDAAVLIPANWHHICSQVWVSIIPRDEAVRRIMERDGRTKDEATARLDSQMSNKQLISYANVVFCSLWDSSFTQQQVIKAMNRLVKKN